MLRRVSSLWDPAWMKQKSCLVIKQRATGNSVQSFNLSLALQKISMRFTTPALVVFSFSLIHVQSQHKSHAGNPIFPGWYADPEGLIFNKEYWVYPTYSANYGKQVFLDAFSSKDLVHWIKHE